jgi:LuxR family maltose regulon positive regulatory protein
VWALYEANELDMAESLFLQNRDIISGAMRADFLTAAFVSMARVYDALGRPAKAEALLDEAESIGRENSWTRLMSTVQWERVRRALLRGATDHALAAAASARVAVSLPPGWIPVASDIEGQEFGEIRLALARNDLDDAAARIDAELKRQRGRVLRQIKLHLLLAVLGSRSGDPATAKRSLRTALRLAQAGGFVRCILDEGEEVLQLLRDERQALLDAGRRPDPERGFIEGLLHAAGADPARDPGVAAAALQPLTERERGMLVLLANGISNKGIANRLFVSENTVKFHLKNIYAKLAVTSRVQAVTAARQIGIVQ